MTTLRRVSLSALCASACLLVACDSGIIEVKMPAAETVAPQDLHLEFTATRHWKLQRVMLGDVDITSEFQPQEGDAGVVSRARHFLPLDVFPATGVVTPTGPVPPSIRQTLEIRADLGQSGDSQGIHHAIKTQDLVIEKEVLTVSGVVVIPTDDPTQFLSPLKVNVAANFPWHGLRVILNDDQSPRGDMTSEFSPRQGEASQAALSDDIGHEAGDWKYAATVLDALDHAVSGSATIHVVKDRAPDCPSPVGCTTAYLNDLTALTSVAVGSSIASQCGGGVWAYTDATRSKCQAKDGDYRNFNPTPSDNKTLCRNGFTPKNVNGKVNCMPNG